MNYVNIHGQPVTVDFRAMVLAVQRGAYMPLPRAAKDALAAQSAQVLPFRTVRLLGDGRDHDEVIGCGATEEAAWMDAWQRIEHAAWRDAHLYLTEPEECTCHKS